VTFRDVQAQVAVPPTSSVYLVRQRLKRLAIGGATPLADGLSKALQVIRQARVKQAGIDPLLVVISDGAATAPATPGGDPVQEAFDMANLLHREGIPAIIIDTSTGLQNPGIMPDLAKRLETTCHRLHHLTAGQVLELIDPSETEEA
jgi:magnesium chelatase subunit D